MLALGSTHLITLDNLAPLAIELPENERISIGLFFDQPDFFIRYDRPPTVGSSANIAWQGAGDNPPVVNTTIYRAFAYQLRVVPSPVTLAVLGLPLAFGRRRHGHKCAQQPARR